MCHVQFLNVPHLQISFALEEVEHRGANNIRSAIYGALIQVITIIFS